MLQHEGSSPPQVQTIYLSIYLSILFQIQLILSVSFLYVVYFHKQIQSLLCSWQCISPTENCIHLTLYFYISIQVPILYHSNFCNINQEKHDHKSLYKVHLSFFLCIYLHICIIYISTYLSVQDPRRPPDESRILVLDISGPAVLPDDFVPLMLRKPDPRRSLTQQWRFTEDGRLCCQHTGLFVQAKVGRLGWLIDELNR